MLLCTCIMPIQPQPLPPTPDYPHWVYYARYNNTENWQTVRFQQLTDSRQADWQVIQQWAKELQVEFDGAEIMVTSVYPSKRWKPKVYEFAAPSKGTMAKWKQRVPQARGIRIRHA